MNASEPLYRFMSDEADNQIVSEPLPPLSGAIVRVEYGAGYDAVRKGDVIDLPPSPLRSTEDYKYRVLNVRHYEREGWEPRIELELAWPVYL